MRPHVTAILTAALLIGACAVVPNDPQLRTQGEGTAALTQCELSVVSWNVQKKSGPRFEEELTQHAQGADFVLLQESTWLRSSSPRPGYTAQVVTFFRRRDNRPNGVATSSTVVPQTISGGWSPGREPLSKTPKSALVTSYSTPSGPLWIVNLHAINFRRHVALKRQLDDVASHLTDLDGPMLVAGDFNAWSRRRRGAVESFAHSLRLQRLVGGSSDSRLDRIFARGVQVTQAEVLRSRVSDHNALRVRLRLENCP